MCDSFILSRSECVYAFAKVFAFILHFFHFSYCSVTFNDRMQTKKKWKNREKKFNETLVLLLISILARFHFSQISSSLIEYCVRSPSIQSQE